MTPSILKVSDLREIAQHVKKSILNYNVVLLGYAKFAESTLTSVKALDLLSKIAQSSEDDTKGEN